MDIEKTDKLYTLTLEKRPEYLFAFLKGDLTATDTRVEAWKEILGACRDKGCRRLLVVQDSPGNPNPTDTFVSSAAIVGLGLDGIKIAFTDLDPKNRESNEFAQMVAANRGAWGQVFTNEEDAVDWLMNSPG